MPLVIYKLPEFLPRIHGRLISARNGAGIGRQLTRYAIEQLHAYKVDVNEDNGEAVNFTCI